MFKSESNILLNCKRYFFVFAAILLLMLTSCAFKGGIKTLAGVPTKTEQGVPKNNNNFSVNTLEKCAQTDTGDIQIVQNISFNANDFLPAVLFTALFLFSFSFRAVIKENKHPLYSGSRKIHNSVPIFLEYRKLILHFSH